MYASEITDDLVFVLLKNADNELKTYEIDFATETYKLATIPNPFAVDEGHEILSASYRASSDTESAFQFIIAGTTSGVEKDGKTFGLDEDGNVSGKQHGFIYGLDDTMFDNCFSGTAQGTLSEPIAFDDYSGVVYDTNFGSYLTFENPANNDA